MMNLFSAIELGKNSVMAQQQVFQVIGHNIANVNTEGYSRQVVDLENVRPSMIGLKWGGRGVEMTNIRSVRDRFIDNQIVERRQYEGKYETLSGIMTSVEALFDESHGLGLSDAMTSFFNGWNDVANNPTDIPTRKALVAKTESFTTAMNNTYQRLIDEQQVIDGNVAVTVDQINSIAYEIAELNQKIAYAKGADSPVNDLMDQRERRLRNLSEMVDVNFYYNTNNNSLTVDVAGYPLVSYDQVNELGAVRSSYNSNYYDVTIDQYGALPPVNITTDLTGGKLGGLIIGRDGEMVNGNGTVNPGVPAGGYTTMTFSQDHELSVGDLITINGETRSVVSIPSTTTIVVEDFTVPIAAGDGWQRRQGYIPEYKNYLDKLATGLIHNVNEAHQRGFALDTLTTDQDFFQMSSSALTITGIATAAGQSTLTFSGNHGLSVGDVLSVDGESRIILSATANTVVTDALPAAVTGTNWGYANVWGNANQIQIDSALEADASLIAASAEVDPGPPATGAVGNNEIALEIARLMDSNSAVDTDNDGTLDYGTFHDYLHSAYSEIGNTGNTANYELEANGHMTNFLENKRESVSGVSLDEEAANLLQFEKGFQAMGRFMGTVSELMDILMNVVR